MDTIGYWVIEWPCSSRVELRSKKALSDMGKRVKGAFQALGYRRGLRRWHFFGSKGSYGYNPHINVLVDGEYLRGKKLEAVRGYLRSVLGEPNLIVNYSYRRDTGTKIHCLKYVTRATFLDKAWDEELATELYNFQNTNYWGRWDEEPAWALGPASMRHFGAIQSLQSGICPECGEALAWSRPVERAWLVAWRAELLGGGYYLLPGGRSPPQHISES